MASVWLAVSLGLAKLPKGVNWTMMHGAALLAGIGFTMSLFIGTLAFDGPEHATSVRVGVLVGSILSGVCGYMLLRHALGKVKDPNPSMTDDLIAATPGRS